MKPIINFSKLPASEKIRRTEVTAATVLCLKYGSSSKFPQCTQCFNVAPQIQKSIWVKMRAALNVRLDLNRRVTNQGQVG